MSFQNSDDNNSTKIANLWGSGWQRLTPKQKQLVSETLMSLKLTNISEQLEDKVNKMPLPNFVEVAQSSKLFLVHELKMQTLTINWQFVLAKFSQALTSRNQNLIDILFLAPDYLQLNRNAINDTCNIINQPCSVSIVREIEVETSLIKEHINASKYSNLQLDYLINKNGNLLNKLKSLEVVGIGSFMLAATMQLLLLQEKAKSDSREWVNVKNGAIEYIDYAKSVNPKIYRLSVGKIDKNCKCIKYKSEREEITQYECRYFDGKDIHVFQEFSNKVGYECNKHRLQMFINVVERVNQTIVKPLRSTIKKWQELAVQIPPSPP